MCWKEKKTGPYNKIMQLYQTRTRSRYNNEWGRRRNRMNKDGNGKKK